MLTNKTGYEREYVARYDEEYEYWDTYVSKQTDYYDDGSVSVTLYNEDGDTVYSEDTFADGTRQVFKYDENGNLIEYTVYDASGTVTGGQLYYYEYDGNGNTTYHYSTYFDGKMVYEIEYGAEYIEEYGEWKSYRIKYTEYFHDAGMTQKMVTEYYKNDNIKSFVYYNYDGSVIRSEYYDEDGNLIG